MNFGVSKAEFVCSVVLLLCSFEAEAHQIYVFAAEDGGRIEGRAYFSGDVAAANVGVEVTDDAGRVLGELVTDEEGRFTFTPVESLAHTFVVQTQDGHRASFTVDVREGVAGTREPGDAVGADGIALEDLREEITGLREEMNVRENRVRLRDVIAGIGYIVGVMGLIAFWKARSKPEQLL